ncbi:hypothetical protein [Corynebacterium pseudopelargi]|uniref:Uncharacterized protein n=1 Tax=Corynebacterium pseudopelargi TaxID=2080757 RepID=A0A3G6IV72_9CORY|nr:hypothetical protein [Corynebacterium pseudopelargi]AZA09526.1 hypothetical protein CPPEL_07080 [Corynebacterium pseudopelargi]
MYSTKQHHSNALNTDLATACAVIEQEHSDTLAKIRSTIRHPRSLARPQASWRPPSITLDPPSASHGLKVAITRRRVGPNVQARIRGYGEHRRPAYVLALRFSYSNGQEVPPLLAEAWVRGIVGEANAGCVHALSDAYTPTFLWITDAQGQALHSPASLFAAFAQAA